MLRGLKSHPLAAYFVLAYAISWLSLGPLALDSQGLLPFHIPSGFFSSILALVGSSGPLLSALLLTATIQGASGMHAFFRQFLVWRVGLRWYLIVLFEPALVTLITILFASLLGGASFDFAHPPVTHQLALPPGANPWVLFVPVFLLGGLVGGPVGEEPGWRGYALAKLQDRYSALVASLILGVLWSVWHLPFFFIKGTSESTTPFLLFALGVIAWSILITWVYNHTRGSVLLALLFHNALNITALYLPLSRLNDWQGVVAQCLVALVVVIATDPARFSRRSLPARPPSVSEPLSSR
ncbi:MAG: CPBP family intramembrane metalloprotease [Chloroflexi bacterium]|nr:CPBP family intramembrane metalloprotease [Chloroflexota bacterium]